MHGNEPQREHEWLQKLVGNWRIESEGVPGPGEPPIKSSGTETVRTLGGLWFLAEGEMTMPDGKPGATMMTLGYDSRDRRYLGTWIGSMMTHLWIYDGAMNDAGTVLALDASGPSMADDGKVAKYRDSIEFKNDDHRVLSSQVQDDLGNWSLFMTAHYHRVK